MDAVFVWWPEPGRPEKHFVFKSVFQFPHKVGMQFLRPQTTSERENAGEVGGNLIINRHKHLSLRQQRELLPIFRVKREILYALEKYRTLVLIGGEIAFPILLLT